MEKMIADLNERLRLDAARKLKETYDRLDQSFARKDARVQDTRK